MNPVVEKYEGLTDAKLEQLLTRIPNLRAGVIGDVCLDVYWEADLTKSTLSRETPHYRLPIITERYTPGAGGNVAANLKALGCREVYLCSAIGNDWRGNELRKQLADRRIDMTYLLTSDNWHTPAYCKPIRVGLQQVRQEDPRIDFQNFHAFPESLSAELAERLDAMAEHCDIIAVTDQLTYGVIGKLIKESLSGWAERGKVIVVDSREQIGTYSGVIVKPNEVEASRWLDPQAEIENRPLDRWAEMALRLSAEVDGVCCMTLGSEGAIWAEKENCVFVPTRAAEPPIDIVGAGDGFASALLCALGSGKDGPEAIAFAHLAASVVIRKIGTTGTASPQEIRDMRSEMESLRL